LDRSLQDLFDNDLSFGGITVLFGGDFRQILPVIPKGSREQIVDAALCRSALWRNVQVMHLTQNMRLDQSPESADFANWLLDIGRGANLGVNNYISLPANMCCGSSPESLVNSIYPEIDQGPKDDGYFLNRTILSCRNDDVDDLNTMILERFPGEEKTYWSSDKVILDGREDNNDTQPYPSEYLASLKPSGLPLAKLMLKVGCPLMLLRNLNPALGLCNGTRMILVAMKPRVLECHVLGGSHAGTKVFIPRISLKPSNDDLPIPLQRLQFPVRLAFAMTINKSQGQSVKHVGLDL
jgi:hypothetical protein